MRRPASAVQLRYLEELAACVAAPIPEPVPAAASSVDRSPVVRVTEAPPRPRPAIEIRRSRPVIVAVRRASAWLLAIGLVAASEQGCSAAFGRTRAGAEAPARHVIGRHHLIVPAVTAKPPLADAPTAQAGDGAPVPAPTAAPLPEVARPPAPAPADIAAPAVPAPEPARPRKHRRPVWPILAGSGVALAALVALARAIRRRRRTAVPQATTRPAAAPPGETPAPWTIGVATDQGRVRQRNEDAGAAFPLGELSVAIVADGLGGMPDGQAASALAVRVAERALRRAWRIAGASGNPAPAMLLHAAFAAVSARLAVEGLRRGFRTPRDGLCTTMIIVIATERRFVFGYIGDGGIVAVAADGEVRALMAPQKADGDALNRLAACLGPFPHGAPVFGSAARAPGDVLIAVSDGVADRVQPRFYADMVLRQVRRCGGDMSQGAARVLAILAAHREGEEHRFDDNMTLALIGDGRDAAADTRATAEAA
jgi:serine/threonine protein phosphatase PrpC